VDKLLKIQFLFIVTCSVPVVLATTYLPFLSLALPHWIMPKLVPAAPLTLGAW
jgi:hypothetical protein